MLFTKEELEQMRLEDEQIEAEFRLTKEEIARSRALDRQSILSAMDPKKRKIAEYKKAYREANREKIAEYQKAYYEANREKIAEHQKAYYEANREKLSEYQKAYREANREKLAEYQKAYREANREKLAEYKKAYYEANREKIAKYQKDLLRSYRREHGLTQSAFGKLLGVSLQLVSYWETGRMWMDPERVRAMAPELAQALDAAAAECPAQPGGARRLAPENGKTGECRDGLRAIFEKQN